MANYLGYASEYNRMGNPIAEGLNQIGDTIQQNRLMSLREATANREMALREQEAAGAAESRGIQNRLSLANLNNVEAQQQGQMSAAGVKTLPEYWQKKAEAEKLQLQQEEAQKRATNIVENYNKIDAMVKAGRIKPETAKEFYSAVMAEQGIDLDEKGMDVDFTPTQNYYSGPITKDAVFMVNGQPVPFNGNGTISKARIVGMQGVKPIFEMGADTVFTESKPDQMDLLIKRDELQSQRDEKNRRAADARLERTITARGGGMPTAKAPAGYRYTPEGNLEAIPGGPAAAKAAAAQQSKGDSIAAIDLSIGTIDKLANHPGRQQATGKSRIMGVQKIPGTAAYDFDRELESFDAQLFLSNISQMKGMGALSNAEGAKVSAAAGAIKPGMSEDAFLTNIKEIQGTLKKARARIESGQLVNPDGSRQGGQPSGNKQTKQLDADTATKFLKRAGGNKDKARQLAKKEGYTF